jgi:molybdate transport system substrate-binding protein
MFMKKKMVLGIIILTFLVLTSCSKESDDANKTQLTILAAASLTDVMEQIDQQYKLVCPDVSLTFSYGSSGTLQTQIEEGAPADVFLSAASKQMDALAEEGLLLDQTRMDLFKNELVLIKPKDSTLNISKFEDVSTELVKNIALGDPEGVPAGHYAKEVFQSLRILDKIKVKANYGSDVKQVLNWVETKEVDCGIVYVTDAYFNDKITVVCKAPEQSHSDIIYTAVVLKGSSNSEAAKAFLEYLSSQDAKKIFKEYGFMTN